jgi:hypothetical protein
MICTVAFTHRIREPAGYRFGWQAEGAQSIPPLREDLQVQRVTLVERPDVDDRLSTRPHR